jgi:hypothetical protein
MMAGDGGGTLNAASRSRVLSPPANITAACRSRNEVSTRIWTEEW